MEGSSNEYGVELNLSNDTAVTNTSLEFYTDTVLGKCLLYLKHLHVCAVHLIRRFLHRDYGFFFRV